MYDRCLEVQAEPYGYLDLWARDHRKSTIITYAHSIQEILASHGEDPLMDEEVTIGIFSHTRPIAKSFLRQIKRELEINRTLINLFPDILYNNPEKEAPTWSEDSGLVVKRKNNPKEATVEAHGLVDGQPVGKHFNRLKYDDVVTLKSVASPDMIQKTTDAWALSLNLGTEHGKRQYIGTRYHYNDSYREIIARQAATPRIHTATDNDKLEGKPILLNPESYEEKVRTMGPYVAACQLMQNPKADSLQGFKREWIQYYIAEHYEGMNVYLLCDPASEKKKTSDYTAIVVIGLAQDQNYYLLDAVRDRLNLTERTNTLIRLHRKWRPQKTGYEKYGKDSDIEHIKYVQNQQNYRFNIEPLGGTMAKNDRIKRLVPIFETGRFYIPQSMPRVLYDGKQVDLIEIFLSEEYDPFPVPVHDDMLDITARITDEDFGAYFPRAPEQQDRYSRPKRRASSWVTR